MKRYIGLTAWLLLERLARVAVGMLVGIWAARHFGPDQFGMLSYALSVVTIFSFLAPAGLPNIVPREVLAQPESASLTLQSAVWVTTFFGFASFSLLMVLNPWLTGDERARTLLYAMGLSVLLQLPQIFDAYFQGKAKTALYAKAGICAYGLALLAKAALILANASLQLFALSFVLDAAMLLVATTWVTHVYHPWIKGMWAPNWGRIKMLLGASWPYLISGLFVTTYMKIDQIMIKEMLGNAAVGQYAAAAKLSEAWYALPAVLVLAIYPAIMNAKQRSESLYLHRLKQLYALMIYAALSLSLMLSLFAEPVVNLLFGPAYSSAASVLKVHIWSSIFVFIALASGRWIVTENLQLKVMFNTLGGAVLNVMLNFAWIPAYGIEGAAWATLIAYAYSGFFGLLVWKKTRPNFWLVVASFGTWPFKNLTKQF